MLTIVVKPILVHHPIERLQLSYYYLSHGYLVTLHKLPSYIYGKQIRTREVLSTAPAKSLHFVHMNLLLENSGYIHQ